MKPRNKPVRGKTEHRPVGSLGGSFWQLQDAGCIQCEVDSLMPIFQALKTAMMGNICDGCPEMWNGPSCKAYKLYHSESINQQLQRDRRIVSATGPCDKNGSDWESYSVAEIAAELGVSKNAVRKMKVAGTLPPPKQGDD